MPMSNLNHINVRHCRLDRLLAGINALHQVLRDRGVDLAAYPELEVAADEMNGRLSAVYNREMEKNADDHEP